VIGNAATITGTVTDATEGQQFPGTSGNYARLNNPIQNAALTELGMMVVGRALTGSTLQYMLSGYNGTAATRGPQLVLNGSPVQGTGSNKLFFDNHGAATSNTVLGVQSFKNINSGGMIALGGGFVPNNPPYNFSGAWMVQAADGATIVPTLFNNGSTWGIGSRPDQTASITGAISYALVSSSTMTPERYAAVYNSALKHGIIQTEATSVLVGMGDSLMQGAMPTNNTDNTLTHKLTFTATGGAWQNICTAQNAGVGGSTITSVEGVQKSAMLLWARADGFANRWVVHFGAHNDSGYQSSDESTRNALMERYIAVWKEAQALGAKIAVVSPLDESSATAPQLAATSAYRTRLATRCTEEGFAYVNLHTDTDFSVASRNATYFVDTIHLSAAGYERATELFVAAIASPDTTP
jgi:lysophospholipase L1-like esterase